MPHPLAPTQWLLVPAHAACSEDRLTFRVIMAAGGLPQYTVHFLDTFNLAQVSAKVCSPACLASLALLAFV